VPRRRHRLTADYLTDSGSPVETGGPSRSGPASETSRRQPPVNLSAIGSGDVQSLGIRAPPTRKHARRARGHGERTAREGTAGKRIGKADREKRAEMGECRERGDQGERRCERHSLGRAPPAGAWSRPAKPLRRQPPVNLNALATRMCNLWESGRPPPRRARPQGARAGGRYASCLSDTFCLWR